MYPKGFVTINIPIHIQCIAMTRKRSEWLQIRKAFWQDLGLSRGFRAPSLENAPTPTVYTGYRFVSGIGMALWNIARHAYITEMVATGVRGRTNAGLGGLGRIAGFVAPVAGGILAERMGLQAPFVVYAALSVAGLVSAWIWIPMDEASTNE